MLLGCTARCNVFKLERGGFISDTVEAAPEQRSRGVHTWECCEIAISFWEQMRQTSDWSNRGIIGIMYLSWGRKIWSLDFSSSLHKLSLRPWDYSPKLSAETWFHILSICFHGRKFCLMTDNINHLHSSVMTEFPVEMCIWLYVSIRQINKQDTNFKLLEVFFFGKDSFSCSPPFGALACRCLSTTKRTRRWIKKKIKNWSIHGVALQNCWRDSSAGIYMYLCAWQGLDKESVINQPKQSLVTV